MSESKTFSSLRVWQSALEMAVKMYSVTHELPKEEQYALSSQLKRAATSVAAHLADGYGRYYRKDKERQFSSARNSIAEAQNYLYLAKELHFLDEQKALSLIDDYEGLSRGISVLTSRVMKRTKADSGTDETVVSPVN